jgi:hypothetical protein
MGTNILDFPIKEAVDPSRERIGIGGAHLGNLDEPMK